MQIKQPKNKENCTHVPEFASWASKGLWGLVQNTVGQDHKKESNLTGTKEIVTMYCQPGVLNNSMDPRTTSKGAGQEGHSNEFEFF